MGLIHSNLRVLMAERGLNIQKVRDQTTLSRTTISNLVNNYGAGIQFDTLKQLCKLLNCQPGDLLTYIDIDPEFKVTTKESAIILEKETDLDDEENSYISSIQTHLGIRCNLRFEGNIHEIKFPVKIKYGINESKEIDKVDIGVDPNFEYKLHQLKLLPYVEDFIKLELEDFLIEWGHDRFFGEEIEGMTATSINYYMLTE